MLAALAMGLLIYPLIQGQSQGWPLWTYVMIVGSLVTFGALVVWTRRARRLGHDPLVEPSIFSHRSYVAGLGSIVVFFAGMIGTLLVLTLYLQFGEHFSAIHAGLTLAPFAVGSAIGATVAATVLVPRFGRTVLQIGAVVIAGGIWWLRDVIAAHGLSTTSLSLAPPQIVLGLGIGMLISPLFGFILASVTDDEVGSASGVLNACQQLAGAVGVAVLGTIFFAVLGHAGFVAAVNRCLLVELCTMPVLVVLTGLLPRQAREDESPRTRSRRPHDVDPGEHVERLNWGSSAGPALALGFGLPPLAPPLVAHQDPQLRVPAVGDVLVGLEVVATVLALFLAGRFALQHRVLGEVPELDLQFLVNRLRFGFRDHVVGHRRKVAHRRAV